MSKTYVVSVDSMRAINADSEEEALSDAKDEFIEMLQRGEAELIVFEGIYLRYSSSISSTTISSASPL
jgi:hypothetical protein